MKNNILCKKPIVHKVFTADMAVTAAKSISTYITLTITASNIYNK